MFRLLNEWDRPVLYEYLMRHEEETDFIIGNVIQHGIMNRSNILRCGDYFGYFEGSILRGIVVFYNMGTCIPHFESDGAVSNFSPLIINRRYSMMMGKDQVIRPIFEIIRHYKPIRELEECSYCVNNNFKPFRLEEAKFLDVSEKADEQIVSFVRKAYWRGFGAQRTIEGTRLLLSQKSEEEDFIILAIEEKLLAQACIQAFTGNTEQIGAVYTLEEERGKGYAKAVVSKLCERIISKGKLPTLIVNKNNVPALDAYKALGFEHREDYIIVRISV